MTDLKSSVGINMLQQVYCADHKMALPKCSLSSVLFSDGDGDGDGFTTSSLYILVYIL